MRSGLLRSKNNFIVHISGVTMHSMLKKLYDPLPYRCVLIREISLFGMSPLRGGCIIREQRAWSVPVPLHVHVHDVIFMCTCTCTKFCCTKVLENGSSHQSTVYM